MLSIFIGMAMIVFVQAEVKSLTSTNFQTTLALNPVTMVEFYAPWCGHCKKFAPIYENVSKTLEGLGILVAKVEFLSISARP